MSEPLKPDQIKESVQRYAFMDVPTSFDAKKWGAMIGWLNRYLLSDDARHLVFGWLFALPGEVFGPIGSSKLTPQMKNGISKWIGTWLNDDTQEWETRESFDKEAIAVLNAARYDYYKQEGQITMDLPYPFEVNGELAGVVSGVVEDPLWDPERYAEDHGAVWCEWCHEELSMPGVPCDGCEKLGAEATPKKTPPPPPLRKVTGISI